MSQQYSERFTVGGLIFDVYDDIFYQKDMSKLASVKSGMFKQREPKELANLPDSEFACIIHTAMDHKIRKYPVCDPIEVAVSQEYFIKAASYFDPPAASSIAKKIVRAANLHKVPVLTKVASIANISKADLPVISLREHPIRIYSLEKTAAAQEEMEKFAYGDYLHFMKNMLLRKQMLSIPDGEVVDELIEKRASWSPEKFVEKLAAFDEAAGLRQYWDHGFANPYDTCCFTKKAEMGEEIEEAPDSEYGDLISGIGEREDDLRGILTNPVYESLIASPEEVFPKLPAPLREAIVAVLSSEQE